MCERRPGPGRPLQVPPAGVRTYLQGTALHGFPGHLAHRWAPLSHKDVVNIGSQCLLPPAPVSTGTGSDSTLSLASGEWGACGSPLQTKLMQHVFEWGALRRPCLCGEGGAAGRGAGHHFKHSTETPSRTVSSPLQQSPRTCRPGRCPSNPPAAPRRHAAWHHPAAGRVPPSFP